MEQKKTKPKPKPKSKPKPKPEAKPKPKPEPESKKGKGYVKITVVKEKDTNVVDTNYDKRINKIVQAMKIQNTFTDDKIRFGWNTGDPV